MKVYAYWDSSQSPVDGQAELLRIWERSWRKQGWEPRLLTIANARRFKGYKTSNSRFDNMFWALQSVGGGWLSSTLLFNNAFKPNTPRHHFVIEPWSLVFMDRVKINTPMGITSRRFAPGVVTPWTRDWPKRPGCFLFDTLADLLASGVCQ